MGKKRKRRGGDSKRKDGLDPSIEKIGNEIFLGLKKISGLNDITIEKVNEFIKKLIESGNIKFSLDNVYRITGKRKRLSTQLKGEIRKVLENCNFFRPCDEGKKYYFQLKNEIFERLKNVMNSVTDKGSKRRKLEGVAKDLGNSEKIDYENLELEKLEPQPGKSLRGSLRRTLDQQKYPEDKSQSLQCLMDGDQEGLPYWELNQYMKLRACQDRSIDKLDNAIKRFQAIIQEKTLKKDNLVRERNEVNKKMEEITHRRSGGETGIEGNPVTDLNKRQTSPEQNTTGLIGAGQRFFTSGKEDSVPLVPIKNATDSTDFSASSEDKSGLPLATDAEMPMEDKDKPLSRDSATSRDENEGEKIEISRSTFEM